MNERKLYSDIMAQIGPDSLRSTFDMLRMQAAKGAPAGTPAQIDELEQRYFYMLRFIAGGNAVPHVAEELQEMAATARRICTTIFRHQAMSLESTMYSTQLRFQALRPEENMQSLISDYLSELERLRTDSASLADASRNSKLEALASDVFMHLWVHFPFVPEDTELVMSLFEDADIPLHDRVLWLGALGLGLLQYDDSERRHLLLQVVARCVDALSAVASLWLVLAVAVHADDELPMFADPTFRQIEAFHPGDVADAFYELFRACGTNAVVGDIEKGILPGMMDLGRRLADRFSADSEGLDEALRNGDLGEGVGVDDYENMKKFVSAQSRGDDVFMATIGRMRSFPFFRPLSAWFMPFYASHSALAPVTEGEGMAFADNVASMPLLCDSDKYALVLSVASAPAEMRDNMLQNIAAQQDMLDSEMLQQASEAVDADHPRRAVMSRYAKNLYRFFTLFPQRGQFPATFDIAKLFRVFPFDMFGDADADGSVIEIARLLMRLGHWPQAMATYHYLTMREPENTEYFFNMGRAAEAINDLDTAAYAYGNILDIEPDHTDAILRLASVLTVSGKYAEVVELLEPHQAALADNVEALRIYADAAQATGDIARALDLYYNISYIDTEAHVQPRIAWLALLTGDFDGSRAAFDTFIDTTAEASDYIHLGHLRWAGDDVDGALRAFAQAASMATPGKTSFIELFAESLSAPLSNVLTRQQYASLRTVPDIIAFRTYGSKYGNI